MNAGHARPKIVQAIQAQAAEMDFAPPFQMAHPKAFELAEKVAQLAPAGMNKVFFTNSGSESVETALKMAIAYHRARGEGARTRLIGRERGYHGVNFGGISVGGIVGNRKMFGTLLAGVDHIRHTHDPARNAFSVGQPEHGAELADDLERLVALHDASTIAAVIVEPIAGSTGVLMPPKGYLQRLREICDKHGILLIFDEVITGFGRTGQPFAAQHLRRHARPDDRGQGPDQRLRADGRGAGQAGDPRRLHDRARAPDRVLPTATPTRRTRWPARPALATLETYADEGLLTRAAQLQGYFAEALHSLKGLPNVIDIRNFGLVGGVELAPLPGEPAKRAFNVFLDCYDKGVLLRTTGDIVALSPPLIIERQQIDRSSTRCAARSSAPPEARPTDAATRGLA